jgi:hypothetical protein
MSIELIDIPSPYASIEEWRAFLRDLKSARQTPAVKAAIKQAEQAIQSLGGDRR